MISMSHMLDGVEATIEWKQESDCWEPTVEIEGHTVQLGDLELLKPSADPQEMADYQEVNGMEYDPTQYHYWDGSCYHIEMDEGLYGFEKWLSLEVNSKLAELNGFAAV